MKVTFYQGDYTSKGKTESVERIKIDETADGAVIDRPADDKDRELYADAYSLFKKGDKPEPKHTPKPEPKDEEPEEKKHVKSHPVHTIHHGVKKK